MAFGLYIHVPYCTVRCGYCDFNTYVLGSSDALATYQEALERELELATSRLEAQGLLPDDGVSTIFVGGGTPSILGGEGLAQILAAVRHTMKIAPGAEVTTEANPETTSPEFFSTIRAHGFTRVSLGMQSVAPHVLRVLDRRHTPGRSLDAAREALEAGFEHVNLDLIYATPGEMDDDVRRSVECALETGIDHLSAYSLIVEEGTALNRKIAHGELPRPSEEVMADRYEIVSDLAEQAGLHWYEVSNFAKPGGECLHNMGYWRSEPWWGAGPGAHSFVGKRRWMNEKLPVRYAARVSAGELPVKSDEVLSDEDRYVEEVMLRLRLAEGIRRDVVKESGQAQIDRYVDAGLLEVEGDRVHVSMEGRLHADGIAADILFID
ncbi:MAG: radical SAM family heme chaperone HemW [Corynebacterium pyruviciproducens]|uniref:radical SAM family heme chaperone HemW n=1 Tax=Corynebacterium pyruviciproducens TaxID=598660 RepID=UPI0039839426